MPPRPASGSSPPEPILAVADIDAWRRDTNWRARATAVIPSGASTASKRLDALYGPDATGGPTHFLSAHGCRILTAGGQELVDCTMALGAVALGYADEGVSEAVARAATSGNVAALSHVLEVEVAERLCDVIPCAEQVRFLKSGAEAVAAAVRVARAYTGRDKVIGCGYFGWLDWWSSGPGIPPGAHADFRAVPFDDPAALEEAAEASGDALAAIVLEPVIERTPSDIWLATARRICDDRGAVLVFDEIKTGFRIRTGGYQALCGVTPDLATFGKAMANGHAISAVVGTARVMDAARSAWISSTLASDGIALAAVGAVLDRHSQDDVCDALWTKGATMRDAVAEAVDASGTLGVEVDGPSPMWLMRFHDARRQTRFLQHAVERGVLFKRGAYNYASLAHDANALAAIADIARVALEQLRDEEDRAGVG